MVLNIQKLELYPQDKDFVKEESAEAGPPHSLKLFGKTVLVTDSNRQSSPLSTCKLQPKDSNCERLAQKQSSGTMPTKLSPANTECGWNTLPCGPTPLYYTQIPNTNSDSWWTLCGGVPYPLLQLHNAVPAKSNACFENAAQDKELLQKEGSWTGSNTGSVNAGVDGDRSWDVETQSHRLFYKEENEQKPKFLFKPSKETMCRGQKANSDKFVKGFVPYKRCLADRDIHSSTITGEEREEQRIRLCL